MYIFNDHNTIADFDLGHVSRGEDGGGGYPPERSFYEESLLNRKLNDKFTYKNSSMLKTSDCDWAKYKDFFTDQN